LAATSFLLSQRHELFCQQAFMLVCWTLHYNLFFFLSGIQFQRAELYVNEVHSLFKFFFFLNNNNKQEDSTNSISENHQPKLSFTPCLPVPNPYAIVTLQNWLNLFPLTFSLKLGNLATLFFFHTVICRDLLSGLIFLVCLVLVSLDNCKHLDRQIGDCGDMGERVDLN
jgi:hypothetical protein